MRWTMECKMKNNAIRMLFVASLFIPQLAMSDSGSCDLRGKIQNEYSKDPDILASTWLTHIELLYSRIPSLSPREEKWLKEEMMDPGRSVRAYSSREYAIQEAKLNTGSLLGVLRVLTDEIKPKVPRTKVQGWSFLAYTLIEYDAARNLAILADENILPLEAFPQLWAMFHDKDFSLVSAIRAERTQLARHILICIIPQVEK